ncbi:MAG: Hsp20/alpha crystallin family protein [Bacteroidota bacterium]
MKTLEKRPTRKLSPYWNLPFDKFFRNDFLDIWDNESIITTPSINFSEEKNSLIIEVAAPGLKKNDFDIKMDGNMLTISCEKETETKDEESENYSRKEYNYSSFSRTVTLPDYADSESIEAKYNDGVLKVTIPKKPETQKIMSQKIKVQ